MAGPERTNIEPPIIPAIPTIMISSRPSVRTNWCGDCSTGGRSDPWSDADKFSVTLLDREINL
jgi:hypothetical protein